MTLPVRILRRARRDIDHVVRWMSEERNSRRGASAWVTALEAALARLANDATGCPPAAENEAVDIEIREAYFKTRRGNRYRIVFTISDDALHVLRIRAPGLDWLGQGDL